LFYKPKFKQIEGVSYNYSVVAQLNFLKGEMQNNAALDMQNIYPEGFVFLNALYGLSWINAVEDLPKNSRLYKEGLQEATWAYNQINSGDGKRVFEQNLPLEYGAFYSGWSNYLLGSLLAMDGENIETEKYQQQFKKKCDQIAEAISKSETPYLETYGGLAWPADVVIAVASLNLHDKAFDEKYSEEISNWIQKVKLNVDPETGLVPQAADYKSGKSIEGARGSSQSLMLLFFHEMDAEFAEQQYQVYENLFLTRRFGLPAVREYPKGTVGYGDIDSGPVILGIGGAASIVGQRTFGVFGNYKAYVGLRNTIEGFGLGLTFSKKKQYLFGILPMADAFIAWSNSFEKEPFKAHMSWRIVFPLISIFLLAAMVFLYYRKFK